MRSWITDYDFYKSAQNLNRQHLQANIYENIHGLASIMDCVDELQLSDKAKVQVKKYKNKPQCKIWIGYEKDLLYYIWVHLCEWTINRRFKSEINIKNYYILLKKLFPNKEKNIYNNDWNNFISNYQAPSWITDELIQSHRKLLIQKEIEKEKELIEIMKKDKFCNPYNLFDFSYNSKYKPKLEKNFHYRNLWPELAKELNK